MSPATLVFGADTSTLIPFVVALVAPIGAYLLAARRMSGKIETSEASPLWEESRAMREDYRQRLDSASTRQRDLEARMAQLEHQNYELLVENAKLKEQVAKLERVTELQARIIGRTDIDENGVAG